MVSPLRRELGPGPVTLPYSKQVMATDAVIAMVVTQRTFDRQPVDGRDLETMRRWARSAKPGEWQAAMAAWMTEIEAYNREVSIDGLR